MVCGVTNGKSNGSIVAILWSKLNTGERIGEIEEGSKREKDGKNDGKFVDFFDGKFIFLLFSTEKSFEF
jgi:hypothetical protein